MSSMKKHRARQVQPEPKWEPLQNAEFPPGTPVDDDRGFVGVFMNNLYQVSMFEPKDEPAALTWLVIRRRDAEPGRDWRHFQMIKNQLCGPEREGFELYPAESRLVDTANQYHMFVLPAGQKMPVGYAEREVSDAPFGKNKNRPFADPPPDLNNKIGRDQSARVAVFKGKLET
jgi:hypothetical protein